MTTADRNRLMRAAEHIDAACVNITNIRGTIITKETEQHTHAIIAALQEQKRIIDRLVLLNDEYDRTHAKDLH